MIATKIRSLKLNLLSAVISCLLCFSKSENMNNITKLTETIVGGNFLKSVINQIQTERLENPFQYLLNSKFTEKGDTVTSKHGLSDDHTFPNEIYLPTPLTDDLFQQQDTGDHENSEAHIPPLSREELIALYQAAIAKGTGLDLMNLPMLNLANDGKTHQVPGTSNSESVGDIISPSDHGTLPGYYYYFYPIANLMENPELGDIVNRTKGMMSIKMPPMSIKTSMMRKPGIMMKTPNGAQKNVEPLFIAMASFVGMAMMFILSILFMPKFGNIRSRDVAALKTAPDEILSLSSVIGEVIEGKDCSKRIACEVGMRLGNKPVRILEVLLPANFAKQMVQIRKSAEKKEQCHLITCKLPEKKNKNKLKNNIRVKPSQNSYSNKEKS